MNKYLTRKTDCFIFQKIFYAVPVNDIRTMLVIWTIPDLTDWHASKVR